MTLRIYFLFLFLLNSTAFSQSLNCNREQTVCEYRSTDLTIGDRVLIVSKDNEELIATGIVRSMDGRLRRIVITKRHAPINSSHDVVIAEGPDTVAAQKYKPPRQQSRYEAGGGISVGSYNIGGGVTGLGIFGFGRYRSLHELEYGARFGFQTLSGQVTRSYSGSNSQTSGFSGSLVTIAPQVGLTLLKRTDFSVRGDATAGLSYLSAAVDGSAGNVDGEGYNTRVQNGVTVFGAVSAGGLYTKGTWHFLGAVELGAFHNTFYGAVLLGASKDIE